MDSTGLPNFSRPLPTAQSPLAWSPATDWRRHKAQKRRNSASSALSTKFGERNAEDQYFIDSLDEMVSETERVLAKRPRSTKSRHSRRKSMESMSDDGLMDLEAFVADQLAEAPAFPEYSVFLAQPVSRLPGATLASPVPVFSSPFSNTPIFPTIRRPSTLLPAFPRSKSLATASLGLDEDLMDLATFMTPRGDTARTVSPFPMRANAPRNFVSVAKPLTPQSKSKPIFPTRLLAASSPFNAPSSSVLPTPLDESTYTPPLTPPQTSVPRSTSVTSLHSRRTLRRPSHTPSNAESRTSKKSLSLHRLSKVFHRSSSEPPAPVEPRLDLPPAVDLPKRPGTASILPDHAIASWIDGLPEPEAYVASPTPQWGEEAVPVSSMQYLLELDVDGEKAKEIGATPAWKVVDGLGVRDSTAVESKKRRRRTQSPKEGRGRGTKRVEVDSASHSSGCWGQAL